MRGRGIVALAGLALLAGCGRIIPAPVGVVQPPAGVVATTALAAGFWAGPPIDSLGISQLDAATALASFRESCPRLTRRDDASGLTRPTDWQQACVAAAKWPDGQAQRFFAQHFEAVKIADGKAFATGYYEPEIAGVRTRQPGYDVPVYAVPPDLVRAKPGDATPNANGTMPLGRYDENGAFVPYFDRGQIYDGALDGKGLEIAWAADRVEMFFLQIQGSGRLRAPDGSVVRIGYAGQNGLPYTGIGGVMRQRGLLGTLPGQYSGSMQGIMQYVREQPEAGNALMRENRSFVFFRELTGDGPLGALGVPVRRESSVAADPAYVPLGAPVWLKMERPEASGLWVAQDTGGAIKGANRFDTFWGAGDDARTIAGGMSSRGEALLLLPKGTVARLGAS